jgi:hypothetical protein
MGILVVAIATLSKLFQATVLPFGDAASLAPAACLIIAVTAFEARRRRRHQT